MPPPSKAKQHGIHYTPPELAHFLAQSVVEYLPKRSGPLTLLDPSCGDGALLSAFCQAIPASRRKEMTLIGFEIDEHALERARQLLSNAGVSHAIFEAADFLDLEGVDKQEQLTLSAKHDTSGELPEVDVVIANPPYVRTQVLGSRKAQRLAHRFGLSGRVDLYHAFTIAMSNALKPGGLLGLLTSNRFLTIRSGVSLRRLLTAQFDVNALYDLGDTRLFSAAVLPAIVVATKRTNSTSQCSQCAFDRVYEVRNRLEPDHKCPSVLVALKDHRMSGVIETNSGVFLIERGVLSSTARDEVWTLSTPESQEWLRKVHARTSHTFDALSHVRVGIKTTADDVFITGWKLLGRQEQPETGLLKPLLTHHNAFRWFSSPEASSNVLYPHEVREGKPVPVDLAGFPRAKAFFEKNRDRLEKRKYVRDAGRKWYEIWVPQNPADWAKPKIVYPDISEFPRFFLDTSGAVVNGDCYWISLRADVEQEWLFLMLAIANSSFIVRYYDTMFHNKLYSGRRRFMTQYVKEFPVPDKSSAPARNAIRLVRRIVDRQKVDPDTESDIDGLVWQAFGLEREV